MARRVRIVVGFLEDFFFMLTKLNKNLYKVNLASVASSPLGRCLAWRSVMAP